MAQPNHFEALKLQKDRQEDVVEWTRETDFLAAVNYANIQWPIPGWEGTLIAVDSQLRGLHFLYPQGKQQELHAKCTDDSLK